MLVQLMRVQEMMVNVVQTHELIYGQIVGVMMM
jgi:hypothetical protein